MPRRRPAAAPIAALALTALTSLALAGCGPETDVLVALPGTVGAPAGLADSGHLSVAVPSGLPPYGFRGSDGTMQGFDVDLARAMASSLGVRLRLVPVDTSTLAAVADPRSVDVVIGVTALTRTAKPPPEFTLQPYVHSGSQMLVTGDSRYQPQDFTELCGHTVVVVSGTYQEMLATGETDACGGAPPLVQSVTANSDAVNAILDHSAEVYLADTSTAAYDKSTTANLMTTTGELNPTELALAVRSDTPTVNDALIRAFYTVRSDGQYEQIITTWGMTANSL